MLDLPQQRPSPDTRQTVYPDTGRVFDDAYLRAACGWELVAATRLPDGTVHATPTNTDALLPLGRASPGTARAMGWALLVNGMARVAGVVVRFAARNTCQSKRDSMAPRLRHH